ncbi:hypothetical protein F4780DRAFT_587807 [Xylariomycetidae sp. FL0641]|nr:hypothetical protein F4780DRAFT_587807 [Xylariomycetidae sp. FL0641]
MADNQEHGSLPESPQEVEQRQEANEYGMAEPPEDSPPKHTRVPSAASLTSPIAANAVQDTVLEGDYTELFVNLHESNRQEAGEGVPTPPGKRGRPPPPPSARTEDFQEKLDEDDKSSVSSGSDSSIGSRVSQLDQADLLRAYCRKLSKTRKTAPEEHTPSKIVESIISYIGGLEERIQDLESKAASDKDSDAGSAVSSEEEEEKEEGSEEVHLQVQFFNVEDEFDERCLIRSERKSKSNTYMSDVAPWHLIRVLYRWSSASPAPPNACDPPNPKDIEILAVRLHSRHILAFLGTTMGPQQPVYAQIPESLKTSRTEILRPLRPLIYALKAARSHLTSLENTERTQQAETELEELPEQESAQKLQDQVKSGKSASDTPGKGQTETSPSRDGPSCRTREAISHFREMIRFLEEYARPQVDAHDAIQETRCSKISFQNLWMLFNSDDTLYCPSRVAGQFISFREGPNTKSFTSIASYTPQAYQVVAIHGGGPSTNYKYHNNCLWNLVFSTLNRPQVNRRPSDPSSRGPATIRGSLSPLVVHCVSVTTDGEMFYPREDFFVFKPFEGEFDITSLEAYPLQFHPGSEERRQYLVDRGRKLVGMMSISHLRYEGPTAHEDKEEVASPVVVDLKLADSTVKRDLPPLLPYRESMPAYSKTSLGEINGNHWQTWLYAPQGPRLYRMFAEELGDYRPQGKDPSSICQELQRHLEATNIIHLLPGVVHGYVLRNRLWAPLNIDLLHPVVQDDGWNDLVLPKGYKKIVRAMVESHAARVNVSKQDSEQKTQVDLVRGKGKGCIILIHGAPGVGKTSTAECVAAYTKRPLFPITCGDVGYQPAEVEKKLTDIFRLAHKWGCVLLLDEADVFLAKRNREDVKRNGLVSVFLRLLEYYSGILFLTTNRVGAIDDAFRSRLHLTLYYPSLDWKKSKKIWKTNLKRLREISRERESEGRAGVQVDEKKIMKFAMSNFEELQWNGRQIRNALQSALALADFEARDKPEEPTVVTVEQFRIIATATRDFDEYLRITHGDREEEIARKDRVRASYKPATIKKLQAISSSDTSDSASTSDSGSDDSASEESKAALKKGKGKSKRHSSHKKRDRKGKDRKKDSDAEDGKKTRKKKKQQEESESSSESDE